MTIGNRANTILLVLILTVGIAIVAMLASGVRGGPLNPPGPVASTQSTVIYQPASCAGFPIVLSAAGSYRLGGGITGCAGKDGIQIAASNITLDLGGFTVVGVPGSITGIYANGPRYAVVKNGSVRGWHAGIDLAVTYSRIEGVRSTNNAGDGITISGNSTVTDCVATLNGNIGISASNVTIRNCTVSENVAGISIQHESVLEGNRVTANVDGGVFVFGSSNTLRNNDLSGPFEELSVDITALGTVLVGNVWCEANIAGSNTVLSGNTDRVNTC